MTIQGPHRPPVPRHMVLAFMAGLSMAAGVSARLYVDELICVIVEWAIVGAE